MKIFAKIILSLSALIFIFSFSYAQEWKWASRWSSPFQVFENFVWEANNDNYKIQKTALDWVTDLEWSYSREYKISNTLDYIRINIGPYIQWIVYIWFVLSTAWLIICWFLLVTWWITKSSWFDKVKWKIVNALLWVFLLSWFYIVIKLMMWIINTFFWD